PTPTPGATDEPVPPRGHGHDEHFGHEAPPIMWVPLVILAVCSIFVGMIFIRPLEHFIIHRTPGFEALGHPEHAHGPDWFSMALGTLAALGGIALSWVFYKERSPVPGKLARDFRPLYRASYAKFWVDQFYMWTVIFPTRVLAFTCAFIDKYIVDGLLVRGTAWVPRLVGRDLLAPYQNGLIQFYAGVTALLVTGLLLILLLT
ncbi:MAG: NADH-quinone oxidoreductase subunit L, partial [Isosphaeraceae bacterium]|nr:NADH-quinone oxidoreductase subunit L [Isosphaeraceae bacterium]